MRSMGQCLSQGDRARAVFMRLDGHPGMGLQDYSNYFLYAGGVIFLSWTVTTYSFRGR